jgi:hypothetical protein
MSAPVTVEALLRPDTSMGVAAPGWKLRRVEESATITVGELVDAIPDLVEALEAAIAENAGKVGGAQEDAREVVGSWLRLLVAEAVR